MNEPQTQNIEIEVAGGVIGLQANGETTDCVFVCQRRHLDGQPTVMVTLSDKGDVEIRLLSDMQTRQGMLIEIDNVEPDSETEQVRAVELVPK